MVSCQTNRWVSTSPYIKLSISYDSIKDDKTTLGYFLYYCADTAANTSANRNFTINIGNWSKTVTYNIDGKYSERLIDSGTIDIDHTKQEQRIACSCSAAFNLTWSGVYCGTTKASMTITIDALTSYKVTYDADGGTGAPSAQTKWHGQALTLSSTKPTRAGYTFQGWETFDGARYQPGASYTTNAGATLYAIWKANTYTITYSANGGTGAPSAQTKWYDETLTLSSTKPTRKLHTFKGWATSPTGVVVYNAGATYTSNASITLYAVWELSYLLPKIYNVKAEWVKSPNILINPAETFVSGTDSNYGYQNLLSSACSSLGLMNGKVYTLTFDWAVNWGDKAPVTNVEVRVGYGEDHGDFDGVSASMTIPNLSTQTSGTIVFTFTHYTGPYIGENAVPAMIQAIYCSSKDALDGTTWTISNVKLVEEGKISVEFDWETSNPNPTGNLGFYYADGSEAHTVSLGQLSGNSGHFERTIDSSNSINIDTSYVVKITLSDGVGNTTSTVTLTGNTYAIDFLAGGNGVAFGGAASLEGTAHFQLAARFDKPVYGNVPGMNKLPEIPANDDFNNYMTTGCWAVYRNDNAETIAHIPVARAGRLEVWSSTGEGIRAEQWSYLRQRYIPYNSSNATWERDISRNENNIWTYSDWYRSTLTPSAARKIYEKSAITAVMSKEVTLGVKNAYTQVPFTLVGDKLGTGFSVQNGGVKIGANISCVKVSGQTLVKCGSEAGNRHARIQRVAANGTVLNKAWVVLTATANSNTVFAFSPIIINVAEGDTIQMVYYTGDITDANQSGSTANGLQTYLTVEEV